jgi:flagellar hook-basal body complex protein FliE
MNPLSALPTLASSALRPAPIVQTPADIAAPKTIPFTELEAISPGILPLPSPPQSPSAGFGQIVTDLVSGVAAKQAAAAESVNGLVSGKNVSLHQTMIAMEEASISFQLMVEVRNKMLEAYQELMRMQV